MLAVAARRVVSDLYCDSCLTGVVTAVSKPSRNALTAFMRMLTPLATLTALRSLTLRLTALFCCISFVQCRSHRTMAAHIASAGKMVDFVKPMRASRSTTERSLSSCSVRYTIGEPLCCTLTDLAQRNSASAMAKPASVEVQSTSRPRLPTLVMVAPSLTSQLT